MNCPNCQRLLYSRRHKKCDFCGAVLPPEALLSEEEITAIKSEQEEIAKRRAADKKDEKEKRKRASRETAKTRAIFGQGNKAHPSLSSARNSVTLRAQVFGEILLHLRRGLERHRV